MVRGLRRTDSTGSALTRLLARLTDVDLPEPRQAFAERLSLWLSWTDAISLSAALDGDRATTPAGPRGERVPAIPEDDEFTRVRTTLLNAIAEDSAFPVDRGQANLRAPASTAPADMTADFLPYRHRYLTRQYAMQTSIAALRGRVRARLAGRSPDMARLAAVDAVMQQMLAARERSMLSTVPALLETRFERLRRADQEAQAGGNAADERDSEPRRPEWLQMFCNEMHDVLAAELDLRLQPVEGLLEALRMRQSSPP